MELATPMFSSKPNSSIRLAMALAVIAGPAPVPVSASDVGGPVRRYYRVRYSTP